MPPPRTLYIKGIVLIFQSRVLSVRRGGAVRAGPAGGALRSLLLAGGGAGSALPVPAGRSGGGGSGSGSDGMARSTLSSRFRRLDIDQYDENRFVEEPEEAAAAEPDASPEVEALLRQYPSGGSGPARAAVGGPGDVTGAGARPAAARCRPPYRPVPHRCRPAAVVSAAASPRPGGLLPSPLPGSRRVRGSRCRRYSLTRAVEAKRCARCTRPCGAPPPRRAARP